MTHLYSLLDRADGDAGNWQDSICLEAEVLGVYLIVLLENKLR